MSEAPERIVPSCVEALENYQQADMDGIMVLASRQAIHETIDAYWARVETCENLEAENRLLTTCGIAEVAVRNPEVMEYMQHWEGRALDAEAKLAKAMEVATNAINNIDALNTLAPDENEQRWRAFDLIDQEVISARTALSKLTGGKDE